MSLRAWTEIGRLLLRALLIAAAVGAAVRGDEPRPAAEETPESILRSLPEYEAEVTAVGPLTSAGSNTMSQLMIAWAADFRRVQPLVQILAESKGSNTAPPSLLQRTAMFGLMSRPMTDSEHGRFERGLGHRMMGVPIGMDLVAVLTHPDNPLEAIDLRRLDAIFAKQRRRGAERPLRRWSELGLRVDPAADAIRTYGRGSPSGTYAFFREQALADGDFRDDFVELPSSWAVCRAVGQDRGGIAFASWVQRGPQEKILGLIPEDGGTPVRPEILAAWKQEYPLARPLWIYFPPAERQPLDPVRREFLRYVLSRRGQAVLYREGYVPLTAEIAAGWRQRVCPETPPSR